MLMAHCSRITLEVFKMLFISFFLHFLFSKKTQNDSRLSKSNSKMKKKSIASDLLVRNTKQNQQ